MDKSNLDVAVKSAFPIVLVETHEEKRALELLNSVCSKNFKALMVWTAAQGLNNYITGSTEHLTYDGMKLQDVKDNDESKALAPEDMLTVVQKKIRNSVIALVDFHPYLTNPKIVRHLKELAQSAHEFGNTFVLLSHEAKVPDEIIKLCTRFELSMPDQEAIKTLIWEEINVWQIKNKGSSLTYDKKALELLARNLVGLTVSDAKRLIRNAIYYDGAITHTDIPQVMQAKYDLLDMQGVLSYEYETASFDDVGGFASLFQWLEVRKKFFLNTDLDNSVDMPKGVLLLGVQGCGKSMAAKAIAGVWGVPLLRLDFGVLYNKYIGETEKNMREALKSAELLSPCVLWIDEIEKGIQSGNDDSGTSQRILGTLLTWMAERNGRVFIVATSNNIESLPPELVRKGRLDEIFFVDLPSADARKQIFEVHLKKRQLDPTKFEIDSLVDSTDGFSGAEIEQAIVSARYAAVSAEQAVMTAHILGEISRTKPLSVVMAEELNALRQWAQGRTVSVH